MEAVSGESSFSRQSREPDDTRYRGGNFILWSAAILVLIGLNFASWSFCMWVFGQPEHPMNYKLLNRLEKLDPIVGFTTTTVPRGDFNSAKELYAKVYPFSPTELRAYNGILKRFYIKNYLERDDVTFLSGEFAVESVQTMEEGSVFGSGLVVRARSTTFPDALVDFALPATTVPAEFRLAPGRIITIEESTTCAAVLHIERYEDDTMIFTAVPLVAKKNGPAGQAPIAKDFEIADGVVIELSIPEKINLEAELWPISKKIELPEPMPAGLSGDTPMPDGTEE